METASPSQYPLSLSRYKSSYEEWKLEPRQRSRPLRNTLQIFLWGMETRKRCRTGESPLRYKSSYEEWKRKIDRLVDFAQYVTNLPMRNGNTISSVVDFFNARVTNLPMRNGNTALTFATGFAALVTNLPMRNGNDSNSCQRHTRRAVTNLPMRNGNGISWPTQDTGWALQIFLWGMETRLLLNGALCRCSVTNLPMRNGNVLQAERRGSPCFCYKSSYEEWKRPRPWTITVTGRLLQIFLWGMETFDPRILELVTRYVTNLPMRNGNMVKGMNVWTPTGLQIFLWGMET